MNKLLILLLLASFSIQVNCMDERPSKRFKKEESADLAFLAYEDKNPLQEELDSLLDEAIYIDDNGITRIDQKIAKEALDKGANPNLKYEDYEILIIAAMEGNKEVIQLLLSNPNIQLNYNILGEALFSAVENNHLNVVDILTSLGADINYKNITFSTKHLTPLMGLISNADFIDPDDFDLKDYLETIKVLIKKGANINLQNNKGETVLIMALQTQNEILKNSDLIPYFIEHGALINIKNNEGETALDIAKRLDNKKVVELLENKINERIGNYQKKVGQKILESTPLPKELTALISEYLEGEY